MLIQHKNQINFFIVSVITIAGLFNSLLVYADIDASRVNALAWLYQHQNSDGSWGTSGQEMQVTYLTMVQLYNAGVGNTAGKSNGNTFNAAAAWMGNANPSSVDSKATQILGMYLTPSNPDAQFLALKSARNFPDYSWGSLPGFSSNIADTALAAFALTSTPSSITNFNYSQSDSIQLASATCYVLTGQDVTSFGWPFSNTLTNSNSVTNIPQTYSVGSILPTAYSIQFLQQLIKLGGTTTTCTKNGATVSYNYQTAINNGINFLLTKQNTTDKGFGESLNGVIKSAPFDSGLVYNAIYQVNPNHPVLAQIQTYLTNIQLANGSWGNDALQTAYAISAFPRTALTISANDGTPDAVKTALNLVNTSTAGNAIKSGNGKSVTGTTVATALSPATRVGVAYNTSLLGSGLFKLTSGSLPDGLSLSTDGKITGIPTTTGNFVFSYSISNGNPIVASINVPVPEISNSDVPLPTWALALMGLLMMTVVVRQQQRTHQ